ncbi:MAG: ABC transporter permease subunit [Chloroflexi bacterium]|nr:ABC transporter permease subunit [Chloroflexota bacterium]
MTVLRNVFTKTLSNQRRALLGWAVGLAGVSLVYAGFYPSVNQPAFAEAMANFPPALMETFGWADIISAEGYLGSTVLGLLGPVLTIILAAATGARAIAGDEEAGTLDLLLARPVGRSRVVLERFGALVASMAWLGLVVWGGTLVAARIGEMSIAVDRVTAAVVALALLSLGFGTAALATGAVTGRRGLAVAVAAALAVAAYLANNLASLVGAEWLQWVSPFFYSLGHDPLRTGFDLGGLAVLIAIPLVLVVVALWSFHRRDVAV